MKAHDEDPSAHRHGLYLWQHPLQSMTCKTTLGAILWISTLCKLYTFFGCDCCCCAASICYIYLSLERHFSFKNIFHRVSCAHFSLQRTVKLAIPTFVDPLSAILRKHCISPLRLATMLATFGAPSWRWLLLELLFCKLLLIIKQFFLFTTSVVLLLFIVVVQFKRPTTWSNICRNRDEESFRFTSVTHDEANRT